MAAVSKKKTPWKAPGDKVKKIKKVSGVSGMERRCVDASMRRSRSNPSIYEQNSSLAIRTHACLHVALLGKGCQMVALN